MVRKLIPLAILACRTHKMWLNITPRTQTRSRYFDYEPPLLPMATEDTTTISWTGDESTYSVLTYSTTRETKDTVVTYTTTRTVDDTTETHEQTVDEE